jgi:diguanylate cyclase (GGDEF)-like protein
MNYHSRAMSLNGLAAGISLLDPDLPVSVAVTDLDGFSLLNEARGAEAGDAVLAAFERTLTERLAPGALIAHVRGDEFAVALPGTACEEALLALESVRSQFAGQEAAPGLTERLTVSVGIAGRPVHGSTAEELLEAADAGLVRAKRAGGNRIAIHVEERMVLKSSYYPRPALHRLAKLSRRAGRPEASLLREALDDYLARNSELLSSGAAAPDQAGGRPGAPGGPAGQAG